MLVESGLVEDQLHLMVVVQELLLLLLIVSTAECVGELLVISLEVQMLLVRQPLHKLILIMSMESASHMEHLVTTSGPTLLV